MSREITRPFILLSAHGALLGRVTQNMRAVSLDWDEATVTLKCYFEGPLTELDREMMDDVETEMIAHLFPERSTEMNLIVTQAQLPEDEPRYWVFARKENIEFLPRRVGKAKGGNFGLG